MSATGPLRDIAPSQQETLAVILSLRQTITGAERVDEIALCRPSTFHILLYRLATISAAHQGRDVMKKLCATSVALWAARAATVAAHARGGAIHLLPHQIKWAALPADV